MTAYPIDYAGASSLLKTASSVTLCAQTLKGQEHGFVNSEVSWDDMQLSECLFLPWKKYPNCLGCQMGWKSAYTSLSWLILKSSLHFNFYPFKYIELSEGSLFTVNLSVGSKKCGTFIQDLSPVLALVTN